MPYRIAGIDVHKKMLAVVVADVEGEGEYQFQRQQFGSNPEHLRLLSEWLIEQGVEEVVMESTQYWQPVGSTGTALETKLPKAGGCRPDVRNAASGGASLFSIY
jgi:hypothetical protein